MLADLTGWGELLAALAAFLLTHAVPARPLIRSRLVAWAGLRAYLIGYSALSILVLGWLIAAAASAPYLELWPREDWQTLVPIAAMPFASVLAVFALTSPNPLSFGPRLSAPFDPARPGVAGLVRHPLLWATLVWSVAHVVPNGDLSHVVMFGLFAMLSVGGMVMLDRRKQRSLGIAAWRRLAGKTSNLPLASLARGWRPTLTSGGALRFVGGIAVYAGLLATHGLFTGIPLLPL